MVKSSDAIDIRPVTTWLQNPTVPANEKKQLDALLAADTNNDGFLEKNEYANYVSNPLLNIDTTKQWDRFRNDFLQLGIWQNWRMANAPLLAKRGQPQTRVQICSDLQQEVGPPFDGPSSTGFSAKVFCGYSEWAQLGIRDDYELLREQVLRAPHDKRLQILKTALIPATNYPESWGHRSDHIWNVIGIAHSYLSTTEYTALLNSMMQSKALTTRRMAVEYGTKWLPITERAPFLKKIFDRVFDDDFDSQEMHTAALFQVYLLEPRERLAIVQLGMSSSSVMSRQWALNETEHLRRDDQLAILQQGAEDEDEFVRRKAFERADVLGLQIKTNLKTQYRSATEWVSNTWREKVTDIIDPPRGGGTL